VPPKIVRPDANADYIPCLFHPHCPGGAGYRESPGIRPDFVFADTVREPFGQFMAKKGALHLLSAIWLSVDILAVLDIRRREFQEFADSHSASRDRFNRLSVARIRVPENDFIDHVPVEVPDSRHFPGPEKIF
jgi:hypothetical protein